MRQKRPSRGSRLNSTWLTPWKWSSCSSRSAASASLSSQRLTPARQLPPACGYCRSLCPVNTASGREPASRYEPDRPELVLPAGDALLQDQHAEVVDLVVDALQLLGGLDVEDVAVEAQLERQRLDGLEHGREADLAGRGLELRAGADEDRLRRVDAGAPGRLHLGALVVHLAHHVPAGEGHDEPGLEPLGVARERPDELVVAGEDDGALRQLRAEGLQPGRGTPLRRPAGSGRRGRRRSASAARSPPGPGRAPASARRGGRGRARRPARRSS